MSKIDPMQVPRLDGTCWPRVVNLALVAVSSVSVGVTSFSGGMMLAAWEVVTGVSR